MSTADTDLRAALVAHPPLAPLVGQCIALDAAPSEWEKYVVLTRAETDEGQCLDGSDVGAKVTYEIECWAPTRLEANAIADAVGQALEGDDVEADVVGRENAYAADVDLCGVVLTIEWWE